jgi:hypothetical protein
VNYELSGIYNHVPVILLLIGSEAVLRHRRCGSSVYQRWNIAAFFQAFLESSYGFGSQKLSTG